MSMKLVMKNQSNSSMYKSRLKVTDLNLQDLGRRQDSSFYNKLVHRNVYWFRLDCTVVELGILNQVELELGAVQQINVWALVICQ